MAHFQNQYGAVPQTHGNPNRQTDEYGNPVRRTDEYGNPVRQTDKYGDPVHYTGTTGGHGTGGFDTTTAPSMLGHGGAPVAGAGIGHHSLHRSGSSSSSSSSSEDDGQGGRRKKGLKQKIKEKLPGVGHKDDISHSQTGATTTSAGYNISGEGQFQQHEKKGMMDKIKEKLPGGPGQHH